MPIPIPDARSGTNNENIQEVIEAGVSAAHALQHGQQQYQTPEFLAEGCVRLLTSCAAPRSVLDPQCAGGRLLLPFFDAPTYPRLYGCDLDNRFAKVDDGVARLNGSCVRTIATLLDLDPEVRFDAVVANPPFGIRWKMGDGNTEDSTLWTWKVMRALTHRAHGAGFLIAARATIERHNLHLDAGVWLYQTFPPGLWENTTVEIGVIHWLRAHRTGLRLTHAWEHIPTADEIARLNRVAPAMTGRAGDSYGFGNIQAWGLLQAILDEEKRERPAFNIYLNKAGMLRTYLSTRAKIKLKPSDIQRLARIDKCHPLTLTTERETRKLLAEFLAERIYTIQPEAQLAIEDALVQVASLATPIRPVTDFELVAYADEEDMLVGMAVPTLPHTMTESWIDRDGTERRRLAVVVPNYSPNPHADPDDDDDPPKFTFTPGKKYELATGTYRFVEPFTRKKLHVHVDELSGVEHVEVREHECTLSGTDRYVRVTDDIGQQWRFLDRPQVRFDLPEAILWEMFVRPTVRTVAEIFPEKMEAGADMLALQEALAGFTYFAGQRGFLQRVAAKDYALIAADVGTGKTLMALSLIALKSPRRTLLIAPQGTMRSSGDDEEAADYHAAQWITEIQRFAPTEPVFQLFTKDDLERILAANRGTLPDGVYISYPQAMFYNDSCEWLPDSWLSRGPKTAEQKFCAKFSLPFDEEKPPALEDMWHRGVGSTSKEGGIRCIVTPALASLTADAWDMVLLDEAHLICNLDSHVTQSFIRLQAKYRYALTATPIPNVVTNLFSLMGWLCVPDWYQGERRNAAWPYSSDERGRFESTFLAIERDLTEEAAKKKRGVMGKCVRPSPVIASPARLLKLIKPTLAFISKEECNPALVPCSVIDVRVPLGIEQARLYAHYLQRKNIPFDNPLTKVLVQMTWLRGICADPATCDYNKHPAPVTRSNFNPKTITILQLVHQCLAAGEQVVVVNARVGQSTAVATRLMEAGIPIARIDSTIDACEHSSQAALFKEGAARVMLMGIKCAQGHSFDACPNLIIGSLEWSYGSLHQAKGRVWRLTSPKPVKVWCVLHQGTIEELLFDRVALKQDAATICLRGQRVPRDFRPVDPAEILAEHVVNFRVDDTHTKPESECEDQWPALRKRLALV